MKKILCFCVATIATLSLMTSCDKKASDKSTDEVMVEIDTIIANDGDSLVVDTIVEDAIVVNE